MTSFCPRILTSTHGNITQKNWRGSCSNSRRTPWLMASITSGEGFGKQRLEAVYASSVTDCTLRQKKNITLTSACGDTKIIIVKFTVKVERTQEPPVAENETN
ncbi:uncharacterized protein LOC125032683 [Penaeus chinensis]|uniref:uncharacterized protein LOC125032683 n=1 Tax=Penaeus chinensis TaxID=139456 RepID=UPI001FB729B6|nr:uncharacterized protein LOC125032683 [Penaeus chinensis]